jgi:hypothetical protein
VVRAYKFLRPGAVGPFSGYRWTPGEWVETQDATLCVRGIHACRIADLPYWIAQELWQVELDGLVREEERKLVAERGRLVRRVEAWDGAAGRRFAVACAQRTAEPYTGDAVANAENGEVAVVGFIAARAAEVADGVAGYSAEREAQARWLADELGLA